MPAGQFAAGCDLLVRLCQHYPKPAFGLTDTVVGGTPVAVTETVVLDQPFCRLLYFERATIYPQLRELIYRQQLREAAESRSTCLEDMAA
jgi:poly-beta-hydroxyalkanoate depolymerase